MLRLAAVISAITLSLGACTEVRESNPQRTATEQLLISTAADRAADNLELDIPQGTKIFVDASAVEGPDAKYAVSVVKDRLLKRGLHIVPERNRADAVVELRIGTLSIDQRQTTVGIDEQEVPIPFAGPLPLPEIALYRMRERQGVAKIGATSYSTADGHHLASADPVFGYSHVREGLVLLFFSWTSTDLPEKKRQLIDLY